MKANLFLAVSSILLGFFVSTAALADDATTPTKTTGTTTATPTTTPNAMKATTKTMNKERKHPCRVIAKACKAAGFTREEGSQKKGKHFWFNCMKPILKGESVSGVTVNSDDVAACKALKQKQ